MEWRILHGKCLQNGKFSDVFFNGKLPKKSSKMVSLWNTKHGQTPGLFHGVFAFFCKHCIYLSNLFIFWKLSQLMFSQKSCIHRFPEVMWTLRPVPISSSIQQMLSVDTKRRDSDYSYFKSWHSGPGFWWALL